MPETLTPDVPPLGDPPGEVAPRPSASLIVGIATGSFLIALALFIMGEVIQLLNMPIGLGVTSLFIFGAAGLTFPAAFGQRPLRFTGLAKNPGLLVLLAIVIGVANIPFADFVMNVAKELLPPSWSDVADETLQLLVHADTTTRILVVATTSLAAPLGEELFFRGWMQGLLLRRFSRIPSVLVVAVLFSAVHQDPVGFVARIELGVVFSLAYLWTGSLWGAIAVHGIHNFVSMAGLYLSDDPLADMNAPYDWTTGSIAGAISLVVTIGLLALLRRLSIRRRLAHAHSPTVFDEPRIEFTPIPAMRIGVPAMIGLTASTGVLFAFHKRLPGAELTSNILDQYVRAFTGPPVAPPPKQYK